MTPTPFHDRQAAPRADLVLVAFLIALDVAARLLPHAPNFTPVAASALFAGCVLRHRSLALLVPVTAMLLSDLAIGFHDWRVMGVVYASLALPAAAGMLMRRRRALVIPTMLSCSVLFFVATNFAVWVFSGMYAPNVAGLIQCYIAALPFFQYTMAGDLFWSAVLFGGAFLVQHASLRLRSRGHAAAAVAVRS